MNLRNKTILITGGASGIGLEAAKKFMTLGNKVIITGRNLLKLEEAKKEYPELTIIQSDAANPQNAIALFEKIKDLGGIDILYNNAGVGVAPLNLGISSDKHLQGAIYEMEVNYFGVIRLNNLFMDMLKSRNEAAIINTTSILSIVPSVLEATYSASKTALSFYTKSLRSHLEFINSSVKVFELLPPLVDTDMVAERKDKKMSISLFVKELIKGLEKDTITIRVGDAKSLFFLNRIAPDKAYQLVNKKKHYQSIQ
ncbi:MULTISPECIES: SDR family oxidoreductase [Chryseobacterium]|uniref:SDR family oxidoreductase n=1 Tax=Chryseobacterium TaxID=59732 RepID=UPI001BEC2CDC|nr:MULTISPECIES: SDR family NAD(P)-dependent oxidoreductase [Chryseobacterium]MBT2620047.1 SDR family NAD(P)-dependent oxidoreductase [Chryseobacterium sp. ISL-6]